MLSVNWESMACAEYLRFGSTKRRASGSAFLRAARSRLTILSIPGLLTLTATCLPSYTARYTWPSEAPDMGVLSISSNVSPSGPSSLSSMGLTSSNGAAGTSSWSLASSPRYGWGSMSARDESHCPSLM